MDFVDIYNNEYEKYYNKKNYNNSPENLLLGFEDYNQILLFLDAILDKKDYDYEDIQNIFPFMFYAFDNFNLRYSEDKQNIIRDIHKNLIEILHNSGRNDYTPVRNLPEGGEGLSLQLPKEGGKKKRNKKYKTKSYTKRKQSRKRKRSRGREKRYHT
jgi:hypothetical protein